MMVNMPVEAMNEKCVNCPELEIDIVTTELYGISYDNTNQTTTTFYNYLKCKHCDRCRVIFQTSLPKVEPNPEPDIKVATEPIPQEPQKEPEPKKKPAKKVTPPEPKKEVPVKPTKPRTRKKQVTK